MDRSEPLSQSIAGTHAFVAAKISPLIVIADGEVAKIMRLQEKGFERVHEIKQPDMHVDGRDNQDKGRGSGVGGNGASAGRHAYEPSMEEGRQEEMALAKKLALWLDRALSQQQFSALVLIAAPQMLGELRKCLSKQVEDAIIAESNKHLTRHPENQLPTELRKIIAQAAYAS